MVSEPGPKSVSALWRIPQTGASVLEEGRSSRVASVQADHAVVLRNGLPASAYACTPSWEVARQAGGGATAAQMAQMARERRGERAAMPVALQPQWAQWTETRR